MFFRFIQALLYQDLSGREKLEKAKEKIVTIAERFLGKGSRYTEIVKLNGLKSNVLYTGQVLQIPETEVQLMPGTL